MENYLQACAAVLLALVLILCLGSREKDMGALLAILVCCLVSLMSLRYLEPVINFLDKLEALGGLNSSMISILLKAVGIGMVSEIAALICSDSGNGSLGKTLQMLGSAVILWLSLPLFTMLIELLESILGEL